MQNYGKQAREWAEKNPFMAGYTVGVVAGASASFLAFKAGEKLLILKLRIASQKNQGI